MLSMPTAAGSLDLVSDQSQRRPYHHGGLRVALLDAAELSLRSGGVEQLSLRDLAREAGVSHGAPRRHFSDKRDLLDALAERGFRRLGTSIRASIGGDATSFSAQVAGATAAFARFATDDPELLALMNAAKHRPQHPAVEHAANEAFAPLVDLIREGQATGRLRAGPVEEIGLVLYATINGLVTLVNTGLVDLGRLDALVETAVDQFVRGAAP